MNLTKLQNKRQTFLKHLPHKLAKREQLQTLVDSESNLVAHLTAASLLSTL